ncbi:helix-turn-helix domain-containing protein [Streptomyces flavotricini]|uniref:Helix-turn-helix domain-containing protein n=1 Tax=Streptomyces flavotricini TaxID=66888 RepID=A0ABS8E7W6_9ACTN|nr:helix-turn-helix domain-containing protein [Streptomyces flavotricini]MCC0097250.1 helix-turn-helix domain-containing protein [Streptomyces flavotricini]
MAFQHSNAPSRAAYGVQHANVRQTRNFTVVSNDLIRHPHLSMNARALASYIQSVPRGTPVGIKALAGQLPLGEKAIGKALGELEAYGYLRRLQEKLPDGRIVTRTVFCNAPKAVTLPEPKPEPAPRPAPEPRPEPAPEPPPAPDPGPPPPAAALPAPRNPHNPARRQLAEELLAELRRVDPRLLLGERDVQRLAGGVEAWLERGATLQAVISALTANLPDHPRNPPGLIAHRLRTQLPPDLTPLPRRTPFAPPAPFQTCEKCDRAFRSPTPGTCKGCTVTRPPCA